MPRRKQPWVHTVLFGLWAAGAPGAAAGPGLALPQQAYTIPLSAQKVRLEVVKDGQIAALVVSDGGMARFGWDGHTYGITPVVQADGHQVRVFFFSITATADSVEPGEKLQQVESVDAALNEEVVPKAVPFHIVVREILPGDPHQAPPVTPQRPPQHCCVFCPGGPWACAECVVMWCGRCGLC